MDDRPTCMQCGSSYNAPDYCCPCAAKARRRGYRTLDIDLKATQHASKAISSFSDYSFNDHRGILQYELLPNYNKNYNQTVGLTPLHYLSNFNIGKTHVFLKDEGQNPSGCFKDRETLMCLLNQRAQKTDHTVIYSSGNAAASAAHLLQNSRNQLITFVPGDTYAEKIDYIKNCGSDVIIIGDKNTSFEKGYRLFADINAAHIFADNGFDNWSVINPYRVQGDKTIAVEIVKQLSPRPGAVNVPDYVIVPTANGSCLAGVWKGFKELFEAGVIDTLPKMVSTGIKNANPVYKAVQKNETEKPVQCDLSKVDEEDADIGSIILAEEGYDSIQAASAVIESNGLAVELTNVDIRHALIKFLEKENAHALHSSILPEPASLTSLAAINQLPNTTSLSDTNIVVSVSTGHGFKARNKIESLLKNKPRLQVTAKIIASKREKKMKNTDTKTGATISAETDVASVLDAFFELQKRYKHEQYIPSV